MSGFGDSEENSGSPQIITPDELKPAVSPPAPSRTISSSTPDVTLFDLLQELRRNHPPNSIPVHFVNRVAAYTSLAYTVLVEWIPKVPYGILKQIAMSADPNAKYQLNINNNLMFTDILLSGALNLTYDRMQISAGNGTKVTLNVKSTGPAITVDGVINGEQVI